MHIFNTLLALSFVASKFLSLLAAPVLLGGDAVGKLPALSTLAQNVIHSADTSLADLSMHIRKGNIEDQSIQDFEKKFNGDSWKTSPEQLPPESQGMKDAMLAWSKQETSAPAIWLLQQLMYPKNKRYQELLDKYILQRCWVELLAWSFDAPTKEAVVSHFLTMDLDSHQLTVTLLNVFPRDLRRVLTNAQEPEERLYAFKQLKQDEKDNIVGSIVRNLGSTMFSLDQAAEMHKMIAVHSSPNMKLQHPPLRDEKDIKSPPRDLLDIMGRFRELDWKRQVTMREMALLTNTKEKWYKFIQNEMGAQGLFN
ncbi:hypothetical protein FRB96_003188 [Tulasnella sp. 330]|nr:hypothetical protein FRB96_003188 [Tulasnella sp. 330]